MGKERIGPGLGPVRYLEAGADQLWAEQECAVRIEMVERARPFEDELSAIIDVNTRLAECVRSAVEDGALPVVLAGDCNSSLGTFAGVGTAELSVVWFDAHGDFNTPETSPSGYFEGMPLAVATGRCYPDVWARIGNSSPISEMRIVLAGIRDLDTGEAELLGSSPVQLVWAEELAARGIEAGLVPRLNVLRSQVNEIYLHIDIDVLSREYAPGAQFEVPGGLSLEELEQAVQMVVTQFRLRAVTFAAFSPERDVEDRTLRSGLHLMEVIAETIAASH